MMLSDRGFLGAAFVMVFVATVALVIVIRKPLCIDSILISKIEYRNSQDKLAPRGEVFRCSFYRKVAPHQFFISQSLPITQRLKELEHLFRVTGKMQKSLKIIIDGDAPGALQAGATELRIGEKLFHSHKFERAILRSYVNQLAQRTLTVFEQEFLAQLLQNIYLRREAPRVMWSESVIDKTSYCKLKHKSLEFEALCSSQSQGLEKGIVTQDQGLLSYQGLTKHIQNHQMPIGSRIVVEAGVPLILKATQLSYEESSVSEKLMFLQNFTKLIDELQMQPAVKEVTEVGEMAEIIEALVYAVDATNKSMGLAIRSHLNQLGFDFESNGQIHLDLAIFSEDFSFRQKTKALSSSAAVVSDSTVWFAKTGSLLSRSAVSNIRVKRLIVPHCGKKPLENLLRYSSLSERVLLVDNCNNQDIHVGAYAAFGVAGFGAENPKTAFVQVHLRSLQLALNNNPLLRENLDFADAMIFEPLLSKATGWAHKKWDERARAYSISAHIDAIEWFRP